jgi:hypothetical protein
MPREEKANLQHVEYPAFSKALEKVLRVSHSDMKTMLEAEKKAKASKPRPSVRVSRAKG